MNEKDERELNALVSMTDEPNETILEGIVSKILSYGNEAIPVLLEKCDNTFDPVIQQQLQEIIYKLQFESLCRDLENIDDLNDRDMVAICIRLAQLEFYKLKEEDIIKQIDFIIHDIWLNLNEQLTEIEKITVVSHVIYELHGFSGNTDDHYELKSSFINTLLETHKGNVVSLGILYIIIARHLHLPVYGVNLPEQFILAYVDDTLGEGEQLANGIKVLFYINPFYKGAIFSRKEVERYLMDIKIVPKEKYFLPCSNLDIIRLLIGTLIVNYSKIGSSQKVNDLMIIAKMLNKDKKA